MRLATLAGIALALAVAAVLLLGGGTLPVFAQTTCPLCRDDIQVEMLQGGQPETLFPAGTKVVSGQVRYNVRNESGNPIAKSVTVAVLDPVGIQVYTSTFTTQSAPYSDYATQAFGPLTADAMFGVYRSLASSGVDATLAAANAIPEPTDLVTVTTTSLTQIGATGSQARTTALAVQRLLDFTEVTGDARTQLETARDKLQEVAETADNVVSAGLSQPLASYTASLAVIRASAQAANTAYDAADPSLASLSNLNIPLTNVCRQTTGTPVPTTFTTNVIARLEGSNEPLIRDSWEWQIGTPSSTPAYGILEASPLKIYTIDVSVINQRESTIRATVLDSQCLPVPDGITVGFATTLGTLDPTSAPTTSQAGQHGIAQTILRSGNTPGTARVTFSNLAGSTAQANVTIVGAANDVRFLSSSPVRYIGAGSTGAPFQVQVLDAQGNVVADGTPVQFTVTSNAGTFTQTDVTTVNGLAQTSFNAGMTLGPAQVTARVPGTGATANQNIAIVGPPAVGGLSLTIPAPYSTTVFINGSEPNFNYTFIDVDVRDSQGQPVADGTSVTLVLGNTNLLAWDPPDTLPGQPPSPNKVLTTLNGKVRAKLVVLNNATSGQVPIVVRATANAAVNANLMITITEPPVYRIFLPAIFRNVICGPAAGELGCYSPPRKAD